MHSVERAILEPMRAHARLLAAALLTACAGAGGDGTETATATTTAATDDPTASACPAPAEPCDGLCVDLASDPAHCGACGRSCPAGQACYASQCRPLCDEGQTVCDGACVDAQADPNNCGGCGLQCPDELVCAAGSCQPACPSGQTACDGACVDLALDTAHCGACDDPCDPSQSCEAGACKNPCEPGQLYCGGDGCVDPQADAGHCGGCGLQCPVGAPCLHGACDLIDINHLLITGQSLSTGWNSAVLSDTQPYNNLRFSTGVRAGAVGLTELVPLIETADAQNGETIASGLANLAAATWQSLGFFPEQLLVSAHGVPGARYELIKQGTAAYAAGLAQIAAAKLIADLTRTSYRVRAVAVVHGESDHNDFPPPGNPDYAANLLAWRAAYDTDARAITGQSEELVLIFCQVSSWTAFGEATSSIPAQQWQIARTDPLRFALVGPKYFLPYSDIVHLTGDGTRWLGEHYAKAYARIFLEGQPWRPLSPLGAALTGAAVVVDFHVPSPPLVLDTELVSDPGSYGFEFVDGSGEPPTITAVELSGPAQVTLTLSAEPTGPSPRIRYAWSGTPGAPAGPTTGPRGNLRDSDPTPSLHGYPLYNWAIHFDEPVLAR